VFDTSGGQGMPTQTFTDSLTLGSGADQVDLYYFGRAHTGGDAWVVFPSLRVMHAGDAFPGKQVPIMDANNGGSGVDYPGTLWNAYAGVPEIDTIITGHSTPMMRDDLREYATFVGALSVRPDRPKGMVFQQKNLHVSGRFRRGSWGIASPLPNGFRPTCRLFLTKSKSSVRRA